MKEIVDALRLANIVLNDTRRDPDSDIVILARQLVRQNELSTKYIEALIWCSGSADFAPDGQARVGWESLCAPLIKP